MLDFLRQRRPHLFSDTERRNEPVIPREVLDYHLESLTKRKQEYEFEHFARRLAEKELCPNLRPQTGPTGGGDSKVDAETYAVDGHISERWFTSEPAAGSERWAFAFSAKEQWASKVRSDVASIASSGRGYARIYFITSRYAPDKKRSALEDELSTQHRVSVTILDRTWILDRVYSNHRLDIAIEALGLTAAQEKPRQQIGPRDAQRLRHLEELDRQIADPARYQHARYSLAEDCLTSALLARGLERPRAEVEARFLQARRVAEALGLPGQRARILYHQAWTAHWWFDDLQTTCDNYEEMEPLIAGTMDSSDIENLATLWQLLASASASGLLRPGRIDLGARRSVLMREYERLAADPTRPNNALQAKFGIALLDIQDAFAAGDRDAQNSVWRRIENLAGESAPLLSFPLEPMVQLIEDIGEFVPRSNAYERALDAFLPIIEQRRSQSAAGLTLMRRGIQRLEAGKPYDAIRLLGRAELRLAKEEHTEDFVQCLHGLSLAYREAGLPWAARTKLLLAVDRCFALLKAEGDIPPALIRTLHDLVWVELMLGRVPQALTAWRHLTSMADQMETVDADRDNLQKSFERIAVALGYLLLGSTRSQLAAIEQLPDTLGALGLHSSRMCLLWALGHEDSVRSDYFTQEERDCDLDALLRSGAQAAVQELPPTPFIGDQSTAVLSCRVLGCEFRFHVANEIDSIRVAEAAMGALEAFFATSLAQPIVPYREYLNLDVISAGGDADFDTQWHDEAPELRARIVHPEPVRFEGEEDREGFNRWLRDLIGGTIARAFILSDVEAWLADVAGGEEAFSRAITLGNVPILASSVFGNAPSQRLSYWIEEDAVRFPLRRAALWNRGSSHRGAAGAVPHPDRAPDAPFEHESIRHSRRRVTSVINVPLWDTAGWSGTGMAVFPDGGPPLLGLMFRNIDAGAQIFAEWRTRFGSNDEAEIIRIAIIQGLKSSRPDEYAVTVSHSLKGLDQRHLGETLLLVNRINRMSPPSSRNLNGFLEAYAKEGRYMLLPMAMAASPTRSDFRIDLAIEKKLIELRRAWQIGPNDPDLSALDNDDDPIVPDFVSDPPSAKALAQLRAWRVRRRGFNEHD